MKETPERYSSEQYLIVGGGNMGFAFASGLISASHDPSRITIIEKSAERRAYIQDELSCLALEAIPKNIEFFAVILLCVKPQDAFHVAEQFAAKFNEKQLLISVMAGHSLAVLQQRFQHEMIIRCMPNLPASVGAGVTVYAASPKVSPKMLTIAKSLLLSVGSSIRVESEELLDAATAISGSGPGYLAYIFNQMILSAVDQGFTLDQANQLVIGTIVGTAKYLGETGISPAELQTRVTSPGGTTAAALRVFEGADMGAIIRTAIQAAQTQSKELGA